MLWLGFEPSLPCDFIGFFNVFGEGVLPITLPELGCMYVLGAYDLDVDMLVAIGLCWFECCGLNIGVM